MEENETKQLKIDTVKRIRSKVKIKAIVDYTNISLDADDLIRKSVIDHARRERTGYSDEEIDYLSGYLFEHYEEME